MPVALLLNFQHLMVPDATTFKKVHIDAVTGESFQFSAELGSNPTADATFQLLPIVSVRDRAMQAILYYMITWRSFTS